MPELKKNRNSEKVSEGVDWAEKLRISMEDSSADFLASSSSENSPEDDELNAIIRASLAQSGCPAPSVSLELDTEGFEMEEEMIEEIVEGEAEDVPEEPVEDEWEEIPEEPVEDEDEEIPEEIVEDEWEEVPKEPVEEEIQKVHEDKTEEIPAAPVSAAPVSVTSPYIHSVVPSRCEKRTPAKRPSPSRAISDDRLNGLLPDETPGGRRLAILDEKNAKLLAEVKTAPLSSESIPEPALEPAYEEILSNPAVSVEVPVPEVKSEPDRTPSGGKNGEKSFRDHLQVGLDDVSSTSFSKKIDSDRPVSLKRDTPSDRYAAAENTVDPEENALRDIDLHIRMGHEEDLNSKDDRLRLDIVRERRATTTPVGGADAVYTHGGREYTDRKELYRIRRDYAALRHASVARFCIAAVGALFGILYDLWVWLML